jgi:pimeloyl-ACP methyl ester carboxylesterase
MRDEIDGARVEVVTGAGHAAHLEAPARVAAMIAGG